MSAANAFAFLKVLKEYPEAGQSLQDFCEGQRSYYARSSVAEAHQGNSEEAVRFACYSHTYEVFMNEFAHYLKNEVRDAQVA